jgi:TolB-like protein/DNA-binding winged helix-turn-helix (wHTH) protein
MLSRDSPVKTQEGTDQIWRFGVFEVSTRNLELRRNGISVRIREQAFRILVHLLEHWGDIVGRDDLRRLLWDADTFVDFEHSLNTAMMKLRDALGDVAEAPIYIETIPKRGYRFIAPVTRPADARGEAVTRENAPTQSNLTLPVSRGQAAPAQASGSVAASGSFDERLQMSSRARTEESFWIAVLPFKSSGSDAPLAAWAEGLTEEIVTGLSRFSYLRVIAPGVIAAASTSRYAGTSIDVRVVGEEVGARYVMEGSLRQAGERVRLAAQLVDCKSGAHLWAETYDRPFSSQAEFELLDGVVPQIVSTIADTYGVLPRSMSEALRQRDPSGLSPYEAVLRGFAFFQRVSAEEHLPARTALQHAVEEAPGNADAWAMLSLICKEELTHRFNLLPDPLGRARAAAQRAVEIAPSNHLAHHALAAAEFFLKADQSFRIAAMRAIDRNPMDGFTLAYLGFLIAYSGDWEQGGELSRKARGLNPHHPGWYWFVPCFDAYRNSDYSAALEFAHRVNMPDFWRTNLAIAAACGQLGEASAASTLQTLLKQRPDIAEAPREELSVWWQPEMVEHLIAGLVKAGLADTGR